LANTAAIPRYESCREVLGMASQGAPPSRPEGLEDEEACCDQAPDTGARSPPHQKSPDRRQEHREDFQKDLRRDRRQERCSVAWLSVASCASVSWPVFFFCAGKTCDPAFFPLGASPVQTHCCAVTCPSWFFILAVCLGTASHSPASPLQKFLRKNTCADTSLFPYF